MRSLAHLLLSDWSGCRRTAVYIRTWTSQRTWVTRVAGGDRPWLVSDSPTKVDGQLLASCCLLDRSVAELVRHADVGRFTVVAGGRARTE
jgi:hypothetical protein